MTSSLFWIAGGVSIYIIITFIALMYYDTKSHVFHGDYVHRRMTFGECFVRAVIWPYLLKRYFIEQVKKIKSEKETT